MDNIDHCPSLIPSIQYRLYTVYGVYAYGIEYYISNSNLVINFYFDLHFLVIFEQFFFKKKIQKVFLEEKSSRKKNFFLQLSFDTNELQKKIC